MSDRPSDGMSFDELRDEFDWMFEFQSRMAEYIRNDPDVHSLAGYVGNLEEQNAKLLALVRDMFDGMCDHDRCYICPHWQEGYNGCEYHARMCELGVEL